VVTAGGDALKEAGRDGAAHRRRPVVVFCPECDEREFGDTA
jgi:hypothetical protein